MRTDLVSDALLAAARQRGNRGTHGWPSVPGQFKRVYARRAQIRNVGLMMSPEEVEAAVRELVEAWFARSGTTAMAPREHHIIGVVTYGLVSHAHALARSYLALRDVNMYSGTVPIVRQIVECSVTAAWVEASGLTAALALVNEQSRQQRNLVKGFLEHGFTDDPSLRAEAESELRGIHHEAGRYFEKRCSELEDPSNYLTYRALSATSHASTAVVDLYVSDNVVSEESTVGLGFRHDPEPVYSDALMGTVLAMLIAAGAAWQRLDEAKHARTRLKEIARDFGVPFRVQLSANGLKAKRDRMRAYRNSHGAH